MARVWWLVGPLLVTAVVAVVASAFVRVDHIVLSPGRATAIQPLIDVGGGPGVRGGGFTDDGQVLLTTVNVGRPTAIEAVYGWLHPDVDVFPRQVITGDQSDDESRQQNLELMDTSKLVATKVALEQLGFTVEVSGTGVVVLQVEPGLPVEGQVRPGDVITAVDDEPVELDDDLRRLVEGRDPGDVATLTVERRDGPTETVDVELAPRPEDPSAGFIGVIIQTRDLAFDFPVEVDIDSGAIGGPSAGLAFTLGLLDRLTPGSLTGGVPVAVTGAINPDGSVGPVGGVAQKAVAADDAGAVVFMVPSDEYDDARRAVGDGLRVERVDTLQAALEVLDSLGGNADDLGSPGAPGD